MLGKGRRPRSAPFGRRTAQALDRYLRARAGHRYAYLERLWLGQNGAVTANGIRQIVRKRGTQAGIEGLHPHQLRHTFASDWLSAGGTETDLMRLAGWRSRAMLSRYGASAADERASRGPPAPEPGRQAVSGFERPFAELRRHPLIRLFRVVKIRTKTGERLLQRGDARLDAVRFAPRKHHPLVEFWCKAPRGKNAC